tara:strand:- start:6189 stop:7211 length:1023 start_codon:yes stop_codon:yes gene_type:complete
MRYLFALPFFLFCFSCSNTEKIANPNIETYDDSILDIIDIYSEIEQLADSISLPEGPVWDKASNSLLFVDVMNNKLFRWNEEEGTNLFISPSGNTGYAPNVNLGLLGANGLMIDGNGDIIVCQHGDRRIAKIENASTSSPNFTTLIDNYEGKRFNSPNDLTYSSAGDIYFTDPAFGFFNLETFQFVESELRDLDFNGVFKYNLESSQLSLITDQIDLPNGIALSPDEKTLYVNKMAVIDGSRKILKINLENMEISTLFDGANLPQEDEGNFDGMKVHSSGNIFTSGPGGLLIISPSGELLGKIDFGPITNCAFDDKEEYLYATGFVNNPKVYRIKLKNNS